MTTLTVHKNLEEIYFPVKQVKAKDFFGYPFPKGRDEIIITDANESSKVLNVCSRVYRLVKNQDFIAPIDEEIKRVYGDNVNISVNSEGGSRFFVNWALKENLITIANGDTIIPMISAVNSYDGSTKQALTVGFHRLVCTNGLTGASTALRMKRKHSIKSANIGMNGIFDKVDGILSGKIGVFQKMLNPIHRSEMDQFIESISENKAKLGFPKKLVPGVHRIIEEEAKTLGFKKPNPWLIYNAFNNVLYKADTKMRLQTRNEIDKGLFAHINETFNLN